MSQALSGRGISGLRRSLRSKRFKPAEAKTIEELEEGVVLDESPPREEFLIRPRMPRRKSLFTPSEESTTFVPQEEIVRPLLIPSEHLVDVQAELVKLEYAPISKIVVAKEGALEGKYIKALNKYCQHIYVELDIEGVLVVEEGLTAHLERESVTETPLNVQMEAFQCAQNDVCGVAFECDGGVCTLTQEETMNPRRTSFVRVERKEEVSALMVGDNIAYPVVKFSEIRANPITSLEAQNSATKALRNQSYDKLVQGLDQMSQYINSLVLEFNTFNVARGSLSAKVHEDLVNLERLKNSYLSVSPLHQQEEVEYKAVMKALCKRNKIVVDILECGMQVTENLEGLKKMVKDITLAKSECLEHVAF